METLRSAPELASAIARWRWAATSAKSRLAKPTIRR